MKHEIKNSPEGFECITCNEPKHDLAWSLSGVCSHLGRVSLKVSRKFKTPFFERVELAKEWHNKNQDIIKKLQYMKKNEIISIEIKKSARSGA